MYTVALFPLQPVLLGFLVAIAASVNPAAAIELQLPIACEPAKTCFIQNYVDVDPGLGAKDYACGSATYDGLAGTDIRVRSLEVAEDGIEVRSAAAGTVKGMRDGVRDHLMANEADREAVKGKECGNGVVIDHGDGWETQYCHMRNGSVRVRTGDEVAAGAALGLVGASGNTEFAHLNFNVRYKGLPVDPFIGTVVKGECSTAPETLTGGSIWADGIVEGFGTPRTIILETGFAGGPVNLRQLEIGASQLSPADPESQALVFFARVMHPRKGDVLRLIVNGPDSEFVRSDAEPFEKDKAIYVGFAGRQRKDKPAWSGRYEGLAEVVRDGKVVASERTLFQFDQ